MTKNPQRKKSAVISVIKGQDLMESGLGMLDAIVNNTFIHSHSMNVQKYSAYIYDELSKEEKEALGNREYVLLAGKYHDVGKYFISEEDGKLLQKESFSAFDRMQIKQHTHMGMIVVQEFTRRAIMFGCTLDSKLIQSISDACVYHHERNDGSGYDGRIGSQIPLIGQLVAVADEFSACTEKRVYKPAKSVETALTEMKSHPLNQRYVEALEKALERKTT